MEEADLDTTLIRINVEIPVNNSFCQYKPAWDFSELFKNRRHVVPCYYICTEIYTLKRREINLVHKLV